MRKDKKGFRPEIFFGTPIFSNNPRSIFRAPLGQKELYLQVREKTQDFREITKKLAEEYGIILLALACMGIKAKIIVAHEKMIEPNIKHALEKFSKELGHTLVKFPNIDLAVLTYPRDLATALPNGTVLINPDIHLTNRSIKEAKKANVIPSPYGEGGRILIKKSVALVNERLFMGKSLEEFEQEPPIELLKKAGLAVGLLPVVAAVISSGVSYGQTVWTYEPEDHIDRISGLLVGKDQKLHLVTATKIYGGFKTPKELVTGPAFSSEATLSRYQQVCDILGIKLHAVSKISVPCSTGFIQFADGRVLLTSGDDEVAEVVRDIIGREKVFLTETPIEFYPAQAKASIRCLIGEFPAFLPELLR